MKQRREHPFPLPPIGLRIIKSAAAVFFCYCIDLLRADRGIVFYSQLAALWCMQDYMPQTRKNASQRFTGTCIGAVFGLVTLLIRQPLEKTLWEEGVTGAVVVPCMIVLVLYTTVLLDQKQASYFSCVVYLSIAVNHMTDADPYLFVWNRFLDTVIGIAVGVAVNSFRLPRVQDRGILFVTGLDDTLLNSEHSLSPYSRVELNRIIEDGAQVTVATMQTPASIMESMPDIRFRLPVIAMDGAALYDIREKRYVYSYVISYECASDVIGFLRAQGMHWFANVIVDDLLVIYYQDSEDRVYRELVRKLRRSPYRNYVRRELPEGEDVVYFMLLDKKERIADVYRAMERAGYTGRLKVLFYDSQDHPGYAYLKIYNHNATKENMIDHLRESLSVERVVTFGSIEGRYTYTIAPGSGDQVVRIIKRLYEPVGWRLRRFW